MRIFIVVFIFSFVLISCKSQEKELTAQKIINKSIVASGVDKISNSLLSFTFRDRKYRGFRKDGNFALERIAKTDTSTIKDVLSNNGFQRFIDDLPFKVADSMAIKYSESINSVHYFSVLPYGLNDGAVKKKLLKNSIVKGEEYYKVQITFNQEGGGIDFEDVFIYWVGKNDFKIDYLAYTFHVDGGGNRFREVKKEHLVNGIRFTDYNNYKQKDTPIDLSTLDKLFEKGELIKISEINLENIQIEFH